MWASSQSGRGSSHAAYPQMKDAVGEPHPHRCSRHELQQI